MIHEEGAREVKKIGLNGKRGNKGRSVNCMQPFYFNVF